MWEEEKSRWFWFIAWNRFDCVVVKLEISMKVYNDATIIKGNNGPQPGTMHGWFLLIE